MFSPNLPKCYLPKMGRKLKRKHVWQKKIILDKFIPLCNRFLFFWFCDSFLLLLLLLPFFFFCLFLSTNFSLVLISLSLLFLSFISHSCFFLFPFFLLICFGGLFFHLFFPLICFDFLCHFFNIMKCPSVHKFLTKEKMCYLFFIIFHLIGVWVNLYNLHFLSSHFSSQPNKK